MAHHHAPNIQLLKGIPRLVQIMREHARLQPILAVIHAACPYKLVKPIVGTLANCLGPPIRYNLLEVEYIPFACTFVQYM